MSLNLTPMRELNRRAFEILSREMGVADTLRIFGQLGIGSGNYTEERRELFANLTLDDIRKGIEEMKNPPVPE